jgi:7-cyano-7-deazaguanine synthase in queuosine biosynthesis
MLIENSQQNIEINLPRYVKRVGLKISGGADSAIVGYMLSKYVVTERPDIKIIPITVQQVGKNYQLIFAKNVIEFYKKEFGNIFLEHVTDISLTKETYAITQEKLLSHLYEKKRINFHFSGLTLNPPPELIQTTKNDSYFIAPLDRIRTDTFKLVYAGTRCIPLINIDKKGVAELYNTLGLMDTLFPLTRSCEKFTDNFLKHCEECWHCAERFYGFGRYE